MKYDLYLKRQRLTLENLVTIKKINNCDELIEYFKSVSIKPPAKEDVDYLFKKDVSDVEKGAANKSNSKKRRVSNKKSSKPKTNDSTSSRGSRSTQRSRKSSNKPQRKSDGGKVEPVQPASGSEDTK
jgi:tRNA uridine 5-carbamoylmethylation protein Kti12